MSEMSGILSAERLVPRCFAAAVHFGVGLVILIPLAYLVLIEWYPGSLFFIDGGLRGSQILIGVDLVLGPGLTFLAWDIVKSRKKLTIDISIIGVLQVLALVWGIYAVYTQRPIALVFDNGTFKPLLQSDLTPQGKSAADLQKLAAHRPPFIYSRPLVDSEELSKAFLVTLNEGIEMHAQFDRLEPLEKNLPAMRTHEIGRAHV